jgi:hypothetical protein
MAEPNRDTLLRSIEDFEATLAELQSNNIVLATPVLLQRLEELGASASLLGDPTLIAIIEKLHRHLTTGRALTAETGRTGGCIRIDRTILKRA